MCTVVVLAVAVAELVVAVVVVVVAVAELAVAVLLGVSHKSCDGV